MGNAGAHVWRLAIITLTFCICTCMVEAADSSSPLFVFGDSYLDTGNHNHSESPWKPPYGFTWPGRPAGRFSDGHVLTDYIAKAMGAGSSPVPYRTCNEEINRRESVKYGVNFAVGGSGAFEAFDPRTLSVQVDQLISMLEAYPNHLPRPQHTTVLLSIGGNDYAHFLFTNGSRKELPNLTRRIVAEIVRNLKRLHNLGLRRFAVSNLGSIGCIPYQTASVSYKHCIASTGVLTVHHNRLLEKEVRETLTEANCIILDQFKAFAHVINHPHLFGLEQRLKPCCHSKIIGTIPACGQIDEDGKALYEVCSDPEKYLFWDGVHPTEAGWTALAALILGQHRY